MHILLNGYTSGIPDVLVNGAVIVAMCAAILFLRAKVSKTREKEARREAFVGTVVLAIMLGVSFADGISLFRPNRGQWQSLLLNVNDQPMCALSATLGKASLIILIGEFKGAPGGMPEN